MSIKIKFILCMNKRKKKLIWLDMGVMTNIICDHGGTIDKYVGDCIMSLFNTPEVSGREEGERERGERRERERREGGGEGEERERERRGEMERINKITIN
jgi:class 3 adenylate cyclase